MGSQLRFSAELRPVQCVLDGGMRQPQNLVPVPDAAVIVDVTERHIWHLLARGDLSRWKAGHRTFVDADQLVERFAPRAA